MFDTMTFTKVVGGFCGALLVFLLGKWGAEEIYHVGIEAHGDEGVQMAWAIDTGEEEGGGEPEPEVSFASLWAEADADAGERVFNQCRACHQLEEGANAVGPYLHGVVGREIGAAQGFNYSGALSEQGAEVWDPQTLYAFLENPQGWAPGTSMSYSGLSNPEDRVNLIAYINTFGGNAEVGVVEGGEEAAAEEAPAEGGSEDTAAAEEAPAEEAPAEDTAAAEAAPAEEAPAEDTAAAEEAPAEEAPAEETAAAEEAPAEEAPAEETAAAEDAPAEEAPAEETAEAAPAEGGAGGSAILANADAAAGEQVFNRCRACHQINGSNGVGPHLDGVVGRDIGSVEGFNYSDALASKEGAWTPEDLAAFLENPREWAPGTRMAFAGLRKEDERANVIAYLNSLGQ